MKSVRFVTVMALCSVLAQMSASQTTERLSVGPGGQSNGLSGLGRVGTVSSNGRYVAFHSAASNLVANDANGKYDVFVRDRLTGLNTRVSVDSNGVEANDGCDSPSMSADGRYVAYHTLASNLVPGDTNAAADIFVHDRQTGQTVRASVATGGGQAAGWSIEPALSADGRYVAFRSYASNLVPGDTNGVDDVFVHDLQTGQTSRVNLSSTGAQTVVASGIPSISGDGRFISFESPSPNLVPGDTNGHTDVFVRDTVTNTTTRVSVSSGGAQASNYSSLSAISSDGRYVAFKSAADNLVAGAHSGFVGIFVHDRQTGATQRVSVSSTGEQGLDGDSDNPSISTDGRYIAFTSSASNFVAGDTGFTDVFVHDRQTGQTQRVSLAASGATANGNSSYFAGLSGDGLIIAFGSDATNLVSGDTNGWTDVFARILGPTPRYTLGIRSANPATGVPMTVWTTDVNGLKSASTSFDRIYNAGTSASVTAPLSVGNQWFERWEKDAVAVPGVNRTITVLMDAPHTIKAVYMTRRTLTVTSQNPNSGVPISVWTVDKNGQSSGNTQFQRTYTQGTTVSLTAPSVVGNSSFRRWNLNGAPWQSSRTVSLPMGADHTLTAVYVAGQTLTVTVTSATPSVTATVWNSDIFGRRDGTTNFSRVYATGGTASVTVPAQVGGKPFVRWEKDGVAVPGGSRTVTVTMDAGHTINAVYASDRPVAFSSNRTGNFEIFVMQPDGSAQTNLSNNASSDFDPSWSPDGSKLAFVSDRDGDEEIYIMNSNGTGVVQITQNAASDTQPTWSGDGTRLAFTSNRDGNSEIYVCDANGLNQINVTNNPSYDFDPSWSPTSLRIAFMSGRLGNNEVFLINSDGSNLVNLTNHPGHDSRPGWSPDGTKLLFASLRDGNIEVYSMTSSGSNQTRLTTDGADDSFGCWSPNGQKIMFASHRNGNWEVYVMNANGSGQIRLTTNSAVDIKPSWKP